MMLLPPHNMIMPWSSSGQGKSFMPKKPVDAVVQIGESGVREPFAQIFSRAVVNSWAI